MALSVPALSVMALSVMALSVPEAGERFHVRSFVQRGRANDQISDDHHISHMFDAVTRTAACGASCNERTCIFGDMVTWWQRGEKRDTRRPREASR